MMEEIEIMKIEHSIDREVKERLHKSQKDSEKSGQRSTYHQITEIHGLEGSKNLGA